MENEINFLNISIINAQLLSLMFTESTLISQKIFMSSPELSNGTFNFQDIAKEDSFHEKDP